jgi:hypothetical protein
MEQQHESLFGALSRCTRRHTSRSHAGHPARLGRERRLQARHKASRKKGKGDLPIQDSAFINSDSQIKGHYVYSNVPWSDSALFSTKNAVQSTMSTMGYMSYATLQMREALLFYFKGSILLSRQTFCCDLSHARTIVN